MARHPVTLLVAALSLSAFEHAAGQSRKPITVDDLMTLRSIADVRIAPQGERVAYVVATPSLTRNQHVAALFLVASSGGAPHTNGRSE